MASLKSAPVADVPSTSGVFSYAQAAKGRSPSAPSTSKIPSTGPSGTATPSSMSIAESTPASSWADDSEVKTQSSGPPRPQRVDSSVSTSPQASASDALGIASDRDTKPASSNITISSSQTDDGSHQGDGSVASSSCQDKEPAPPKPILHEARLPAVNIWQQRAAEAKAKAQASAVTRSAPVTATPSVASRSPDRMKSDARRRSEQPPSNSGKKTDSQARARQDPRPNGSTLTAARPDYPIVGANAQRRALLQIVKDRPSPDTAPPPPLTAEVAWPRPTDALAESAAKRPSSENEEKDDKDRPEHNAMTKPHGKIEWKVMPYTPSAVFETPIYSKQSSRAAPGAQSNAGRSTANPSTRGGPHGAPSGSRGPPCALSLPNGDTHHSTSEQRQEADIDRQRMPPPSAFGVGRAVDASSTQTNGHVATMSDGGRLADDNFGRPSTSIRRHQSLKKVETSSRRNDGTEEIPERRLSLNGGSDRGLASYAGFERDQRRSMPLRAADDSGREGGQSHNKRAGKKSSNRNSMMNGTYPPVGQDMTGNGSHRNAAQPNFLSQRGGTFTPGRASNAYRGSTRSQSIPLDPHGRPTPAGVFPGYQMSPGQQQHQFVPDFYNQYQMMPYPVTPSSERDMLFGAVAAQLEYYFSLDNLLKDMFLRKHMDSQGWIFLSFIADFNRLKQLSTDYELLKSVCLQSTEIEIKVGDDGKDRVRRVESWEQFVLPMAERDQSARTEGPAHVRPPYLTHAELPSFYPSQQMHGTVAGALTEGYPERPSLNGAHGSHQPTVFDPRFADFHPSAGESRGRTINTAHPQREASSYPEASYQTSPEDIHNEADRFPSSQLDDLTVVVRKHRIFSRHASTHYAKTSRTFSDGSIDSGNIAEELERLRHTSTANGAASGQHLSSSDHTANGNAAAESGASLTLFWVKDKAAPIDIGSLPSDTTHEQYTQLRIKALEQREAAATGTCPYDLDVLYQFWSHFLIRNFNTAMYQEFHHLALADAKQRHSDVGLDNIVKYYIEALSSQIAVLDVVVTDYAGLLKMESEQSDRPAFKALQSAWNSGSLHIKNRKKLNDVLDGPIRAELDI